MTTKNIFKANSHIHSPYSFSAFTSIQQAVEMAANENIKVLGINDFYTTNAYEEFHKECTAKDIYPLFNIEFIGLMKDLQSEGIRINDPANPGRIYFSGKGLKYPTSLPETLQNKVDKLKEESHVQIKQMITKANAWFAECNAGITLSFEEIKNKYATELVRERHLAKAIRIAVFEKVSSEIERIKLFAKIFDNKEPKAKIQENSGLENEIRGNLLKIGGKAFVPEDDVAFLSIEEIQEIILAAGGIPCYPTLLDDANGKYTDFEKNWENMHDNLLKMNVKCIELIPGRNSLSELQKFVHFFHSKNFIILFGTEHNTPDLIPLTVECRNNTELPQEINEIANEGAYVVAAHQYLVSNGEVGFNQKGSKSISELVEIGKKTINTSK